MKSKKLIRKLWKLFPLKLARKYHDYVGLMVPRVKEETNKIITCLDITPHVIEVAINNKVDMIITHHPFLYGKKSYILTHDEFKKKMYDTLFNNNIAVYSFHTNFDEGKNGMNDALANLLELNNIRPITILEMARCGELDEEMDIIEFSKYATNKLNLNYSQLINKGSSKIKKVGILGGSGSRDYYLAIEDGCDIFLSGDTPYHIRREIIDKGYNYLHIDHEVEKVFCYQMKKLLSEIDNSLEIIIVDDVEQSLLITR